MTFRIERAGREDLVRIQTKNDVVAVKGASSVE